jgi:hypothetical protein
MDCTISRLAINMGIWFYAGRSPPDENAHQMKTTVELPDPLYRRAKAEAALRGRKLKDLVEQGLRLVLDAPPETTRQPSLAGPMKHARGVIESGVPDLGSNPQHLQHFGRDASHR